MAFPCRFNRNQFFTGSGRHGRTLQVNAVPCAEEALGCSKMLSQHFEQKRFGPNTLASNLQANRTLIAADPSNASENVYSQVGSPNERSE